MPVIDLEALAMRRAQEQLAATDFRSPCPEDTRRRRPGTYGFKRGAANARNKRLSEAVVLEIRRRRAAGETLEAIGSRHGITDGMVSKIVNRRAYAWVEEAA